MRKSVAGRAGGRPTESGIGRRAQGTTARTRTALRSAVVAIGVLTAALVGSPAWAAPAGPVPAAAPSTAPSTATDDTSDADRPVQIEVSDFEPRTLAPDAVISITCTLTNTGDTTISHLALRLQRGAAYATRAELTAADRVPDPATTVVPAFTPVPGSLEPGDSITFTYTLPAAALQVGTAGVYPALLNANGSIQGTERRVGQLATYLVQPPTTPTARTAVAWLWPLVDRTHRNAAGRFTDDDLARDVASNGRLNRDLAAVERLPKTTPAGGGASAPNAPVTLAIDPALVEELQIMAAGPYQASFALGTP